MDHPLLDPMLRVWGVDPSLNLDSKPRMYVALYDPEFLLRLWVIFKDRLRGGHALIKQRSLRNGKMIRKMGGKNWLKNTIRTSGTSKRKTLGILESHNKDC